MNEVLHRPPIDKEKFESNWDLIFNKKPKPPTGGGANSLYAVAFMDFKNLAAQKQKPVKALIAPTGQHAEYLRAAKCPSP